MQAFPGVLKGVKKRGGRKKCEVFGHVQLTCSYERMLSINSRRRSRYQDVVKWGLKTVAEPSCSNFRGTRREPVYMSVSNPSSSCSFNALFSLSKNRSCSTLLLATSTNKKSHAALATLSANKK